MSVNDLPETLPTDAKGYTKRLKMHMNFGPDGGAANYEVYGPEGEPMPITYQYDTRKKGAGPTGFFIDGVDQVFKRWADLVAYWPTYIAERAK